MKVAFILGPLGHKYQGTYYDKFVINDTRPWLKTVPRRFHIDDNGYKCSADAEKRYVRIDFAVGYCLKYLLPNHDITFIHAVKISDAVFKKFDLIINQFMDLLIVPFMKKFEKNKVPHQRLREIYAKHAKKLYPPAPYANMIYDKCKYYKFLKDNKIPVAPTVCITRRQFKSKDKRKIINSIVQTAFVRKWGKVFSKPVYGTDGIDATIHAYDYDISKKTLLHLYNEIESHLQYMFNNPRYPAVVFQKYITDFETTTPQVRMYYIGDTFQYSILTDCKGNTTRPKSEGGTDDFDMKPYRKLTDRVLVKLSKSFFQKKEKLVTRIDCACCLKGKSGIFINEIEFNPGMYLHLDGKRRFEMDAKIATQLARIIKKST